jgi:hypothetical protein
MRRVVACVPDLMDRSKVAAVVSEASFVPTPGDLAAAVAAVALEAEVLAVIDLSRDGAIEAIVELAAAGVPMIGFGSHVDHALLERAREAGCGQVVARSAFFRDVAALLK